MPMRSSTLTLEAVEDRSVPAVSIWWMPFAYASHTAAMPAHEQPAEGVVRSFSRGWERNFAYTDIVFRIRFDESIFVFRIPSSYFDRTDVFVGTNPHTPTTPTNTDSGDYQSAGQTSSSDGGGQGPVASQPPRTGTAPRAAAGQAG